MTRLPLLLCSLFIITVSTEFKIQNGSGFWSPTDSDILEIINHICTVNRFPLCPKTKYSLSDGKQLTLNRKTVSESVQEIKKETFESAQDFAQRLRKEFCCDNDVCFKECGLTRRKEKDIIKMLPKIYKELFALGFEELKPYEKEYTFYLNHQHHHKDKFHHHSHHKLPAYVEELYDIVHEHEEEYISALKAKGIEI